MNSNQRKNNKTKRSMPTKKGNTKFRSLITTQKYRMWKFPPRLNKIIYRKILTSEHLKLMQNGLRSHKQHLSQLRIKFAKSNRK